MDLVTNSDLNSKPNGCTVLYRNWSHCTDADSDFDPDLDPQLLLCPFLPPATKLGQGNVFTGVCDSVHSGGAWLLGGMRGFRGEGQAGACVVAGGHAWLPRGVHGCRGARMVAGGHVWLPGGMHGCRGCMHGCQGAYMVAGGMHVEGGACVGYDEIWRYDQSAGSTHPTGMHSCGQISIPGSGSKSVSSNVNKP